MTINKLEKNYQYKKNVLVTPTYLKKQDKYETQVIDLIRFNKLGLMIQLKKTSIINKTKNSNN
jgi:hypothetical protein